MELFTAGSESQLETIYNWIDNSDIYMLIFHVPHNIALNNGNTAQCELAAFVCCSDETAIQAVSEAIKNLHS